MTKHSGWLRPGELPYSDRETSRQAAKDAGSRASSDRTAVLAWIREAGARGATDDEIERALDMKHQTASARRRELVLAGLIAPTGERRPTRSGSPAQVWRAVLPRPVLPVQERLL